MGQARRFENSISLIGVIRNCSINANGKKVGIISNSINNNGSAVNHSFHVFDLETDAFVGFDLGKDHIPVNFYWDKKEVRYFGIQAETSKTELSKGEDQQSEE